MFRGVSVLLDGPDSERGALAHAREWASRLRLPLRAVEWPLRAPDFSPKVSPAAPPAASAERIFRPFELCVFGKGLPAAFKESLFSRALRSPQTSVMICPQAWRPASRVLILNQHRRPGDGFVETVAAVCLAFRITPILLTATYSEADSPSRERAAEEAFARRGLAVDCDLLTGCDVFTAVAHAARWRRCSHVFVERRPSSRWRRWLCGDVMRELAVLSDSLTLVAVPEAPESFV